MEQRKSKLSVAKCREALGKKFDNCTDEQILEIRDFLYQFMPRDSKSTNKEKQSDSKNEMK